MIKSRDRASRCRVRAASSGLAAHRAERDGATHHQPRPTCPQWTHGAIESNSWAPKGPPKKNHCSAHLRLGAQQCQESPKSIRACRFPAVPRFHLSLSENEGSHYSG